MDFTSSFPILVRIVLLLNIPDPNRPLRTSLLTSKVSSQWHFTEQRWKEKHPYTSLRPLGTQFVKVLRKRQTGSQWPHAEHLHTHRSRCDFTVFPWDARGLEAGLGAGIDENLRLLLEGCHQFVHSPTPTFTRAFAGVYYDGYWGLKGSWTLQLWGAGSLSHLRQGRPRLPQLLPPESQPVSQASKILLRSPSLFTWLLQRQSSQLPENCNTPNLHPGVLPWKCTQSLSDEPRRLYNSLSCPPQTYQSFTIPSNQSLQKEWD